MIYRKSNKEKIDSIKIFKEKGNEYYLKKNYEEALFNYE